LFDELVLEEGVGEVDVVGVRGPLLEESMFHLVGEAVDDEEVSVQVGDLGKVVSNGV
jgi:hypothetical protein